MSRTSPVRATVLVPTRDRPADLARCLGALSRQTIAEAIEVVVIDDGSKVPVQAACAPENFAVRVLRLGGTGPARARNAGAAAALGPLLLLLDDDVEPSPEWAEAACAHLETHPGDAGVEGPISTPPWDPLYAYSFVSAGPGAYLTCNVAYRASVFCALGGFYEDWPTIACEDHDLAYRVLRVGSIGFEARMSVVHHPRRQTLAQIARRGLHSESAVKLFERHPDRFSNTCGQKWLRSTVYTIRWWKREARTFALSPGQPPLRPGRAVRFACAATAQTLCSVVGVFKAAAARTRVLQVPTNVRASRSTSR